MAALSNEVKAFIVQALACFDTPSQVAEAVKAEFRLEISRQLVETHDPTKRAGKSLAKRWVVLFNDTRERFRSETAEIPIANRAYRLRALGRFVEKAEGMRNIALAMQALEQAAKECGDAFVNHRPKPEASQSDAVPVRVQVDVVDARKPDADA